MALVFYSDSDRFEPWRDALTEAIPDLEVRNWDDAGDPAEIDFALVWLPPQGALRRFPNLKAILNLGAGVDALLKDPDLPKGVPIVRMVDDDLAKCMAEYVLLHVLRYHREQPALDAQQRAKEWRIVASPAAGHRRVGIMGLGAMGGEAARHLLAVGFDVASWTRSARSMPGVEAFHGADGLGPFLAGVISDRLQPTHGTQSLAIGLVVVGLANIWAAAHYFRGARTLREDFAATQHLIQTGKA